MKRFIIIITAFLLPLLLAIACGGDAPTARTTTIIDGLGRSVTVPMNPSRIVGAGPGCLRYLVYLQVQENVIAVEAAEKQTPPVEPRPYALAVPRFTRLPSFGDPSTADGAERLRSLKPAPLVIFLTYPGAGVDADSLQEQTGIPVVALRYGDLTGERARMYESLRLIGNVMQREDRAQAIINYIDGLIEDLAQRTAGIEHRKSAYVGGVSFQGPRGLLSTDPAYAPFQFSGANNIAAGAIDQDLAGLFVTTVTTIQDRDPEFVFIDLGTYQLPPKLNAVRELKVFPQFRNLHAVREDNIYLLFPDNWYGRNYSFTLANSYVVGKTLYPDRFQDVDPPVKADAIFTFLVGKPVFGILNKSFGELVFKRLVD